MILSLPPIFLGCETLLHHPVTLLPCPKAGRHSSPNTPSSAAVARAPHGSSHTSSSWQRSTRASSPAPASSPCLRPPGVCPPALKHLLLSLPIKRPPRPSPRQENKAVSHLASLINLAQVAGSFNGSRHGKKKPVPSAATLGTKTKLRFGGGEGKGGEGIASQGGARMELVGFNCRKSHPGHPISWATLGRQKK